MSGEMSLSLKQNLIGIDLLRFLAAFSVYYNHQHIGHLLAKLTHFNAFIHTDTLGAYYAVPLFFLISGFCIHFSAIKNKDLSKTLTLKKYYSNRFWRIYPPYLIALLLSIVLLQINSPLIKIDHKNLFNHFFLLQGFSKSYFNSINLVLWTITIEACFYVIYPVFYFITRKYSIHHALGIATIVSLISCLYFQLQTEDLSLPKQYFFCNLWFGWCFGAWLCHQYVYNVSYFKSRSWKAISISIILAFVISFFLDWEFSNLFRYNLSIIVWAPLLIWCAVNENKFSKFKKYLTIPIAIGISSYSLYLLHQPLIEFKNFIIHYYFNDQLTISILMIVGIVAIPAVCYLNYRLFELPFIKFRKNAKQ